MEINIQKNIFTLEINDPNGRIIYQGNFKEVAKFNIRLPMSGKYNIVVRSRWCDGIVYLNKIGGV